MTPTAHPTHPRTCLTITPPPPHPDDPHRAHQTPAAVAAANAALTDSPFFRLAEANARTATLVSSTDGTVLRHASNAAFAHMFLHAGDFLQESTQRRTLQLLLFSSCVWLFFVVGSFASFLFFFLPPPP
jgi:hypothetical protein